MLELILSVIVSIMGIIILLMYRDILSKNYLIKSLRQTNKQLFDELIKYKGE